MSDNQLNQKRKILKYVIPCVIVVLAIVIGVFAYFNAPAQRLKAMLDLGYKYIEEENYDEAIACFKQALEINNESQKAKEGLVEAYILFSSNSIDYEEALRALEECPIDDNRIDDEKERISNEKYAYEIVNKMDELYEEVGFKGKRWNEWTPNELAEAYGLNERMGETDSSGSYKTTALYREFREYFTAYCYDKMYYEGKYGAYSPERDNVRFVMLLHSENLDEIGVRPFLAQTDLYEGNKYSFYKYMLKSTYYCNDLMYPEVEGFGPFFEKRGISSMEDVLNYFGINEENPKLLEDYKECNYLDIFSTKDEAIEISFADDKICFHHYDILGNDYRENWYLEIYTYKEEGGPDRLSFYIYDMRNAD